MNDVVLLDAGPLGMVSHPHASADAVAWLAGLVAGGVQILIPEIADYEVRRELLRANRLKGVRRLDQLKLSLGSGKRNHPPGKPRAFACGRGPGDNAPPSKVTSPRRIAIGKMSPIPLSTPPGTFRRPARGLAKRAGEAP